MKSHIDKVLYQIGWTLFFLFALLITVLKFTNVSIDTLLPPCIFHRFTGLYCPGCGGTRAVIALSHGHVFQSALDHPLVFYGVFLYLVYMVSNTIERLSRGKWNIGFRYSDKWVYFALAIVILNLLLKNVALILLHIDLLK